jgi:sugar-specific transcriptional regulator TrmB
MKSNISQIHANLVNKLRHLGLSVAESLIYLYLLERGDDALVSKIAFGTRMHRQQVYLTIPKLLAQGLIDEIREGKRSRYRARPPRTLERVAERKVIVAEEVAKDLEKISKLSHEQDFEVIVGVAACRAYEIKRAQEMGLEEKQYIIGTERDEYLDMMGEVYASVYAPILEKKKVETFYLAPQSQEKRSTLIDKRQIFHLRTLNNLNLGPIITLIQGHTLIFYVNVHPSSIYVIKSQRVAAGYKDFFMMLWEMAGEGDDKN